MEVSYDNRAITLDGERMLILSGAIHYPRSTPQMWPKLMEQSRQAGLNTIETYVFWNLHEPREGEFDFSGRLDLLRFCRLAQEHGLYVILRVGPYICAEINYGGFPFWLREVPGMQMRTDNEPFKRKKEKWVRYLMEMMRPMLAPNGGPIILAQIENEYNNIAKSYGDEGQRYLQWAIDLGRSLNTGVPWITCLGAGEGSIETINDFRAHHALESHFARHPDQPAIWTEAWASWYDTFGVAHHRRSAEETAYSVMRFFAGGGSGVNYYMWHGGTNFAREAMYLQTTSYDFDAPLDEYGDATPKYHHLAALHHQLSEYGNDILKRERAEPCPLGEKLSAFIYGPITFLCNDGEAAAGVRFREKAYQLAPLSVKLLCGEEVVFDTAVAAQSGKMKPAWTLSPARLEPFWIWQEPMPANGRGRIELPAPAEQLQYTKDETDYCWYETDFTAHDGEEILTLTRIADIAYVFVDNQYMAMSSTPLLEERGAVDTDAYRQEFRLHVTPGKHRLSLLCCAIGLIKLDSMLGGTNMVNERKGLWGPVLWNGKPLDGQWQLQPGLIGEHRRIFSEAPEPVSWSSAPSKVGPLSWLRSRFTLPATEGSFALDLSGMTKGIAWINGHCIGRYWLIRGESRIPGWWPSGVIREENVGNPSQSRYHVPSEWLQLENELVIFEENGGRPADIQIIQRKP